ncbi:S9 family peptidase [Aggregicoccus sp. 17bor-14]|uniref:S9 family peptidase n=1 Tax=Myxococcaceae TaxID=31 RepID=UPI00129CD3E0|nr:MULTISPECIES: prolyl oligopeptidase family serine peptidase [Myxococcaceae]MBF5043809.1 S9 family peptidase [Simulacricoccus sp. 17bor-14]MRI89562.1 S9 family peptidase [Aggregicoccus sp. 17bor-14]
MRTPLWLAVLLAGSACSGTRASAPPPDTQAQRAPPAAAPAPAAAAPPAPAPAAAPAQAAPDPAGKQSPEREAALAQAVAPFFDAFVNQEAAFSRDGRQVLFVSNRDGLPQLYVADVAHPTAPARRLTRTTERVTGALPLPDGTSALVRMDTGADENWRLYRVELATGELTGLTPGEVLQRDDPQLPERAPEAVFFSARKMAEKASALYRLPLSGGAPGRVYEDTESGFLTDVSEDGRAGLWLRMHSASNFELMRVDLHTGEARRLYPAGDTQAAVSDARFTPDGQRVLLATDAGGEQAVLLALDARDGHELARYVETQPATAELAGLEVSPRGDAVAVDVNAGNRHELRLLDARTLRPRTRVQLPLGFGALGRFSQDGQHLSVTWSTPSQPTDVYGVDARSGRVTPLRREQRPGLASLPPVEASIVQVRAHDGLKLPVNVYLPRGGATAGKRMPVIVSYHGGPASSYAVRWSPAIGFFLSQGYAWVEPNVRGSSGFGRAYEMGDNGPKRFEAFKDIETTARWAASQPWADAGRMVVYGGSYGGYTTLITLERNPDLWRAGVDLFGVANMRTFLASTSGVIRDIFREEFGELGRDDALLESLSPLAQVDRIVDPLFVYAGANDPRVPRSESDQVVAALRQRGVPVEYMVAPNEGHSLARRENQIEAQARIARFLEQYVKAPAAGPAAAPGRP